MAILAKPVGLADYNWYKYKVDDADINAFYQAAVGSAEDLDMADRTAEFDLVTQYNDALRSPPLTPTVMPLT